MQDVETHEITRKAKSNLAFAFISLPKKTRQDMVIFYAFCRVIDDIVDEQGSTQEEKTIALDSWVRLIESEQVAVNRASISTGPLSPALQRAVFNTKGLAKELLDLIARCHLKKNWLLEIVEGCRQDINSQQFDLFENLLDYTYKVACCVGLVSQQIFGCTSPKAEDYAIALGHALQFTNIIRDVSVDFENGRIYLPSKDFSRFGYSQVELAQSIYNESFVSLMKYEANRAWGFFQNADSLLQAMPREEQRKLSSARLMHSIYSSILSKIENDQFRVFTNSYKLSKFAKISLFFKSLIFR